MDQVTIQTIMEGLILIILIYVGGVLTKVIRVLTKIGDDIAKIAAATTGSGTEPAGGPRKMNVTIVPPEK